VGPTDLFDWRAFEENFELVFLPLFQLPRPPLFDHDDDAPPDGLDVLALEEPI